MNYKFIVFEGIDGSGKTTQSKMLSNKIKGAYTYEPTEGDIGKVIRGALSGKRTYRKETLALLFAADRMEHVPIIKEMLKNQHVVCDRYLYSSMVYQSIQGVELDFIININKFAIRPDVLIFLDVDIEESINRMGKRDREIFENREMLELVSKKYYEIIKNKVFEPKYGYIIIDTSKKTIEEVHSEILKNLRDKGIL
ncbi:dTMP kinase [Methanothermococcus sp. SCGC AD-155-C09]|nr:dTMP kinase [Methanothermococcus sp. SCGC AD-155-C09]